MIFLKLWNYIFGYLVIRVDGLSLEKFINLCVSRDIKLWKIQRTGYTSLRASIGIKDFRNLPPIARKIRIRVRIIEKRGLPFLAHRLRYRKMLIFGMLIFLVILYGLSSFIWMVEIDGEGKYDKDTIFAVLEGKGLRAGVYKGNIELWPIENELLIEMPELSWVSIEIKGTKAIVRVVEAISPPELVNRDEPCNIVANKDGIIDQLIVLEGDRLVEVGDTVREGQLLISGVIEHEDTKVIRYVHAKGKVLARIWYEGKGIGEFNSFLSIRTGRVISRPFLETRGWEVALDTKEISFGEYEIEERREKVPILGRGLGWHILYRDYYETEAVTEDKRDELARQGAEENSLSDAMKKIPKDAKVIDKNFEYDIIKDKGYKVTVYVEVLEDIARQVGLRAN